MEKSRHGCMIAWDQELTMMLLDMGVLPWLTVLTGQGFSLVVLVKKVIPTWLSGMKLKGQLRGRTMDLGNGRLVLFSLTQPETTSWLLEMSSLLNSGIWMAPAY
uniref:Uncharacterized protein n=1 Tax=Arundo donax TaxID=35708 RepID=A0A0A9JKC7_ARUDO